MDKKLHTCLFLAIPPTDADWDNIHLSKIDRLQIFLSMALQPVSSKNLTIWAKYLWELGYEVIIRVPEPDAEKGNIDTIVAQLKSILPYIYAIIWGNEPESEYDLTANSKNWGNQPDANYSQGKVFYHNYRLNLAIDLLNSYKEVKSGKVAIISPGWRIRQIGESDPEQPGQQLWADVCHATYARCYANGIHDYGYSWKSPIDKTRALKQVARMKQLLPGPYYWVNEWNIDSGTDLEQAQAFIELGNLLSLDSHITGYALFITTGVPDSWDPVYLVKDISSYIKIGDWIRTQST